MLSGANPVNFHLPSLEDRNRKRGQALLAIFKDIYWWPWTQDSRHNHYIPHPSIEEVAQTRKTPGGGGMYFLGVVIGDLVFLGVVQAKFFKKIKLVFVRVYIYLPSAHLMHTNTQLILRNIKE